MQVNMHEAKSQLSKLGEAAWSGESVIIAKSGKPYLELVPHKTVLKERKPGRYKDQIKLNPSFNNESKELNDLFEADL
ncbi:type II toxin-antitoxin system Phd/YefM family antitoxin [Catenovulum sp. SX2]|uniref:type II toxin-antitoxin system Phd/YefM family antitoxin n=1 Tax=Catenovulum sp. SX2 TaxID=3398614 RepID=UPI003F853102